MFGRTPSSLISLKNTKALFICIGLAYGMCVQGVNTPYPYNVMRKGVRKQEKRNIGNKTEAQFCRNWTNIVLPSTKTCFGEQFSGKGDLFFFWWVGHKGVENATHLRRPAVNSVRGPEHRKESKWKARWNSIHDKRSNHLSQMQLYAEWLAVVDTRRCRHMALIDTWRNKRMQTWRVRNYTMGNQGKNLRYRDTALA